MRLFCAALALLILWLLPLPAAGDSLEQAIQDGSLVRLHVIADSDAEYDQRVKYQVRDALLETYGQALAALSPEEARSTLQALLPEMTAAAQDAAAQAGHMGSVTVSFAREDFPARSYDGILVPAGQYDALCVRLGSAQGRNWWCVMYPPLCLLAPDLQDVPASEPPVLESAFLRWLRSLSLFQSTEESSCINELQSSSH